MSAYAALFFRRSHRAGVLVAAMLACALCTRAGSAQSGFYRYVDESGKVRYTDNPSAIPAGRSADAPPEISFENVGTAAPESEASPRDARRIVINYDAKGSAIFVHAVINRSHPAVFLLDTGATNTMITESDARMLEISTASTRRVKGLIADGSVVDMPLVRLASVEVGEARVENLKATVGNMRLLGMDFLGSFDVTINAQAGQLVLTPKDPARILQGLNREPESDLVRQDRQQSKRDIDNQIAQLELAVKARLGTIEQYRDDIQDAETKRSAAEASLGSARSETRFQGSGVSRDQGNLAIISRIEESIKDIDDFIQNRIDNIQLLEQQTAGMRSRIDYLRALRRRIE